MDAVRVAAIRIATRTEPVVLRGPLRPKTNADESSPLSDYYDVVLRLNVEGPGIEDPDVDEWMDEDDIQHLDDPEHTFTVETGDWYHEPADPSVGYMSAESYPQRTNVVAIDGLWLESQDDRGVLNAALEAQIGDYDWTEDFESRQGP